MLAERGDRVQVLLHGLVVVRKPLLAPVVVAVRRAEDAQALGIGPGGRVRIVSPRASAEAVVEITDRLRPGHVTLPNGLGLAYPDEAGKPNGASAGRFDIGPERILPRRNALFRGPYKGEITGARSARLTSSKDLSSGFQIVREFSLAAERPHLICKQTVINISKETRQVCYWCRTFALGQGICVVPVSGFSRMPKRHVMYDDHLVINFAAENDNITERGGCIIVDGPPEKPKLGFDSMSGWMAYLTRNDLMFVKRWQTFPNRVYGEMASLTLSIKRSISMGFVS